MAPVKSFTTSQRARRLKNLQYRLRGHGRTCLKRARALLPRDDILPDFLIIGSMKCGTTSLYYYLGQHPGIRPAAAKEIGFLNDPAMHRLGERWYRAHFPTRAAMDRQAARLGYRPLTGEASPSMMSRFYALNAARHVPRARLIAVLRDPVERAYSHYQHNRRTVVIDPLSFWDALMAEEQRTARDVALNDTDPASAGDALTRYSYARRGFYIDHIAMWLEHFPREQLRLVCYEQFIADPLATCNEIADHLGLPPHDFEVSRRFNPGHYTQPMDQRCRDYLTERMRPYNRRLFDFLGEDWGWPS